MTATSSKHHSRMKWGCLQVCTYDGVVRISQRELPAFIPWQAMTRTLLACNGKQMMMSRSHDAMQSEVELAELRFKLTARALNEKGAIMVLVKCSHLSAVCRS